MIYKKETPLQTNMPTRGFIVPRPGVEPGWIAPLVFETSASTDSAIWAYASGCKYTASFGFNQRNKGLFLVEGIFVLSCLS